VRATAVVDAATATRGAVRRRRRYMVEWRRRLVYAIDLGKGGSSHETDYGAMSATIVVERRVSRMGRVFVDLGS
jgi:hypothetical protein